MKKMLTAMSVMMAALMWAPLAGAAEAGSPEELVEKVGSALIEGVRSDPTLTAAGGHDRLEKLIEDKVIPSVNFERMTASAVGPAWRQASPEQRQKLQTGFKKLLINVYAGALTQLGNQQLVVKPGRRDPAEKEALVKSELKGGGDPVELSYRLVKSEAGWRISNMNVMGVWIAETYRSQFTPLVNQKGIEGLISWLDSRGKAG